jgi:CheY-like chemotaxis protein
MLTAHSKKRILCIEDDPDTCRLIAAILTGYEMVSALSADEAWRLYNEGPFSLLILDYRLGESNGMEFCERIRQQDYLTPIIFITGDPNITEADVRIAGGQRLVRKGEPAFLDQLFQNAAMLAVSN